MAANLISKGKLHTRTHAHRERGVGERRETCTATQRGGHRHMHTLRDTQNLHRHIDTLTDTEKHCVTQ